MGGLNLPWRVVSLHEGPNAEVIDEYKIVDANGNDLFEDAGSYTIEGSVTRKEVADFIVRMANGQGQAETEAAS